MVHAFLQRGGFLSVLLELQGDAYIAVTNLTKPQDKDHAKRIAEFAIDAMRAAAETPVVLDDPSLGFVQIRIGFHSGPLTARVVGTRTPKYSVFGDTVNTASRMESTALASHIQCSSHTAGILQMQCPSLNLVPRGKIPIKGKGEMETFFLTY